MAVERIYDDSFYQRLFKSRFPFKKDLNEDFVEKIYLAGLMERGKSEDSKWRSSLHIGDLPGIDVQRPDEFHFDHGGDRVRNCVARDIKAINNSDGVIAYFGKSSQVGTFTELMHAMYRGLPILVVLDPEFVNEEFRGSVDFRWQCEEFWFLFNYIMGDADWDGAKNVEVVVGKPGEIQEWVSVWIETWFNYEIIEKAPKDGCCHPLVSPIESTHENGRLEIEYVCDSCRTLVARKWVEGDGAG